MRLPKRIVAIVHMAFGVTVLACESFGADSDPSPAQPLDDAAAEDAPSVDGPRDAGSKGDGGKTECDAQSAFTASELVSSIDSPADQFGVSLTPDETTIFLESKASPADGTATERSFVYTASRATRKDPFGALTPVETINALGKSASDPWVTPDNKTLYFTLNDGKRFGVWSSTRSSASVAFGASAPVTQVNDVAGLTYHPTLATDGSLFFTVSIADEYKIYELAGDGASEVKELAAAIGPAQSAAGPVISASGLVLYFEVVDRKTSSNNKVWMADRTRLDGPFERIHAVDEVNQAGLALPGWLSPDMCRLYVAQKRVNNGVGNWSIYVYSRAP